VKQKSNLNEGSRLTTSFHKTLGEGRNLVVHQNDIFITLSLCCKRRQIFYTLMYT